MHIQTHELLAPLRHFGTLGITLKNNQLGLLQVQIDREYDNLHHCILRRLFPVSGMKSHWRLSLYMYRC